MTAIDDDLWKMRTALLEDASKSMTGDEVKTLGTVIDVGVRSLQSLRDLAASMEKLAKSQEEIASSLKDIAMHFNHKVSRD